MALTLTIGGTDRTAYYEAGTLRISEKLDLRYNASFTMSDASYRPTRGQSVVIADGATTHFEGIITRIKRRLLIDDTTFRYFITCGDHTYLFQNRLVNDPYDSQTLKAIVEDIIDSKFSLEGFDTSNVLTGPTIDKAVFSNIKACEAFDMLADITGYHWYIGTDKQLYFEERTTSTSAFNQTDASNNFLAGSMEYTTDLKRYRNRQLVRAGTDLTASRTETYDANETRRYGMMFPLGIAPTIRVDTGSGFGAATVGIRGLETGKDWYYQKNDHFITQDDGDTPLTITGGYTEQIEVTYQGLFPLSIQAEDVAEMASRASEEGGSGVYENLVNEPDIDETAGATEIADGLLRRYGAEKEIVTYKTDGEGLRAGTLQTIDLADHDIDDTFMIVEVSGQDLKKKDGYIRYTIKAVSGEYVGGWEKMFADLLRGGRKLTIRESEVVSQTKSLSDTLNLGDATFTYPSAAPETRCGYGAAGYSETG
jgi:hypothetical protein|tara:strand:- start:200 stop:1642 length:1443 start_codon:yes stop_codon:yes gene_type:complete